MANKPSLPSGMVKRGRVYYANFRCDGKLVRKALSPDLSVAKKMLKDLRLGVYRRSHGDMDNDYLLADLERKWFRSIKQDLKQSSVKRYRSNIDNINRLMKIEKVSDLNWEKIEDFREERLLERVGNKYVQPQTVNKDVAALCRMLNWGVERREIATNPILGIKKLREEPKESRALTPTEVDSIFANNSHHWNKIFYAYFVTGLRKMELANLLFSDIDFESREIAVRAGTTKTSTERRVPIDDKLFEIIVKQKDEAKDRQPGKWSDARTTKIIQERFSRQHVFVTTANTPLGANIYREFVTACGRANIQTTTTDANGKVVEVVSLHTTRHTFATNLIGNGADPRSVQSLLGHRTLDMTMKIYAKVFSAHKHAAIAKLSLGSDFTFQNEER